MRHLTFIRRASPPSCSSAVPADDLDATPGASRSGSADSVARVDGLNAGATGSASHPPTRSCVASPRVAAILLYGQAGDGTTCDRARDVTRCRRRRAAPGRPAVGGGYRGRDRRLVAATAMSLAMADWRADARATASRPFPSSPPRSRCRAPGGRRRRCAGSQRVSDTPLTYQLEPLSAMIIP